MIVETIFGVSAIVLFKQKKSLIVSALTLTFLYSYLIIYLWCNFKVSTQVLIATLFWSYGIAMFPFVCKVLLQNIASYMVAIFFTLICYFFEFVEYSWHIIFFGTNYRSIIPNRINNLHHRVNHHSTMK